MTHELRPGKRSKVESGQHYGQVIHLGGGISMEAANPKPSKLENPRSSLSSLIRMRPVIGEATTSSSGSSCATVDAKRRRNPMEAHEQELQFDEEELRREVSRGADQARKFEQRFNAAAALPATMCSSLITDAAAVLATFTSIIKLLNRGSSGGGGGGDGAPKQLAIGARPSPTKATPSASPASPILSGVAMTPPQSPRFASPRSSPAMTPAATPDGSPSVAATSPAAAAATEDLGLDFPESKVPLSRKRKHQPRKVEKVRASSNEQGIEQPPEDGFTWRKYGQKDILNSKHPKSYYRCSLQKEMGCPAVRYVQKSEDEPGYFLVTYIAEHTCKQQQQQPQQQQLGTWTAAATRLSTTPPGASTSCAALSLTSSGGIQVSLPSSYSYSSRLEDMARLSSASRPITASTVLIRPSVLTPGFGAAASSACFIKAEPLIASASTLASGSCVSNTSASFGLKEEQMEAAEGYDFEVKLPETVVEGENRSTDAGSSEELWPMYLEDHGDMMF